MNYLAWNEILTTILFSHDNIIDDKNWIFNSLSGRNWIFNWHKWNSSDQKRTNIQSYIAHFMWVKSRRSQWLVVEASYWVNALFISCGFPLSKQKVSELERYGNESLDSRWLWPVTPGLGRLLADMQCLMSSLLPSKNNAPHN